MLFYITLFIVGAAFVIGLISHCIKQVSQMKQDKLKGSSDSSLSLSAIAGELP